MLKMAVKRGLIGAPIGVMICTAITIFISLAVGDGHFYPIPHELIDACGSEITAAVIQFVCSMVYGAVFGASAVIWQIEKWSLLRQTVTHLAIIAAVTFPIAYLMHWMEHSVGGVLGYMALTLAIYAVIWAAILLRIHRRIKRLNAEIRK